ncbi:hypothetical protein ACO22_04103 [Paracoccidioides brasiliensis]|uniref:Zn(2)-C6 fungal-type domain-containing protein n=1 Tax=Paracoccidioides brasiliensis TaxID=121759 RepID=A0A1D2JE57_PARBR|nr:hypothetical protein ACO22_04103 [Paracoccidioides brasiliensis]
MPLPSRSAALPTSPQTSDDGLKFSSESCYTCRRRRVICDRLLPTCKKCHRAKKTCLGYKKPFTWVQGVASRGKMMGLTFGDVAGKNCQSASGVRGAVEPERSQRARSLSSSVLGSAQNNHCGMSGSLVSLQPGYPEPVHTSDSNVEEYQQDGMTLSCSNSGKQSRNDECIYAVDDHLTTISLNLVDPLFQGLDSISRYYLAYYDRKFCALMVLFEIPHRNPYRLLLRMINTCPGLCAAMAAIAACHNLHVLQYSGQSAFDSTSLRQKSSFDSGEEFMHSPNPKVRVAYQHLLLLKQRALRELEENLSNPNKRGDEATIASALLLMVLDMVESGRGTWKLHVEGAKKMLETRFGRHLAGKEDELSTFPGMVYDSFNMFLAGTCMTFDIMGSTLTPSGTWSEPLSSQLTKSPSLLSDTEKNVWLGCPGPLLRIILFISSLRHADSSLRIPAPIAGIYTVLSQINAFDPRQWAREMQQSIGTNTTELPTSQYHYLDSLPPPAPPAPSSPEESHYWNPPQATMTALSIPSSKVDNSSTEALFHVASAYKIAITLYATRILLHPSADECPFLPEQVTEVLNHLSHIQPSSELFKSLLWPTFIAGAECRCPEQRAWIRDFLDQMWRGFWTVNIRGALRVLDAIWGRESQEDGDWAEYFDRSGVNWLFI